MIWVVLEKIKDIAGAEGINFHIAGDLVDDGATPISDHHGDYIDSSDDTNSGEPSHNGQRDTGGNHRNTDSCGANEGEEGFAYTGGVDEPDGMNNHAGAGTTVDGHEPDSEDNSCGATSAEGSVPTAPSLHLVPSATSVILRPTRCGMDDALVVGSSDGGMLEYKEIEFALTDTCDATVTDAQQYRFAHLLEQLRWQDEHQGVLAWQRLHRNLVNAWVAHLTSHALGLPGINRINAIITAYGASSTVRGVDSYDLEVARRHGSSLESNLDQVKSVFETLARVLEYGVPTLKKSKFEEFCRRVDQCALHRRLDIMREEYDIVDHMTRVEVCRVLDHYPTTPGVGEEDSSSTQERIKQYIIRVMGWSVGQYAHVVESTTTLAQLAVHYGAGVCLLLDTEFINM